MMSSRAHRPWSPDSGLAKRIPQYLRVYELLRRRIEEGEHPIGAFLPPEPKLGKQLHVSRTTVRKAVELLVEEGFLAVRRGRGTEILDARASQRLHRVTSFSETLREQGFHVRYRDVEVKATRATGGMARDLAVVEGDPLIRVHRLAVADGRPIAIMDNHLLPDLAPGIEARAARIQSLYALLESEYNLSIEAATDFITARGATCDEAATLGVAEGCPLLLVRRVTFARGRPVERADLRIVASRYQYSVRTSRRPGRA